LSKHKSKGYTERISVGFTLEQMRRIEEILRVRARRGEMRRLFVMQLISTCHIRTTFQEQERQLHANSKVVSKQSKNNFIDRTSYWKRSLDFCEENVRCRWIASRCVSLI